ncbi:MAG: methyltransferase domain-containing protein [Chlorobi bacterium]|nr:methyltransferase domain-containing protein [Chlorobiota bacterium]
MTGFEYLKPNYPADAFEGTALYYSRYRVPYPQVLIKDLINRTSPPQKAKLLDLASGPGRVAIALASFFSKVLANDVDADMVSVGKSEAEKNKTSNIEWLIGRAEELKIESNSVDLITIGEAFHRLDQSLILDLAYRWLKPGSHIAIVGMYSIWRGDELWHKRVSEITDKWTPNSSGSNKSEFRDYGLLLNDKGFTNCTSYPFEFPHYCTIDSIIGYLHSTSRCSKKVLGEKAEEFESELKSELNKISEEGVFFENIRCGYTLGKKP